MLKLMDSILSELDRPASQLSSVIIAAGDEEFPPQSMLEYISPVLNCVANSPWAAFCFPCKRDRGGPRFYSSRQSEGIKIIDIWSAEEGELFQSEFPSTRGLTIVLVDKYASQVFQLLDGISSWLTIVDVAHPALTPIVRHLRNSGIRV